MWIESAEIKCKVKTIVIRQNKIYKKCGTVVNMLHMHNCYIREEWKKQNNYLD